MTAKNFSVKGGESKISSPIMIYKKEKRKLVKLRMYITIW